MAINSPTQAQQAFLEGRGIVVPPTKGACSLLIGYIKNGNNTIGNDEPARIALTVAYQRKWIGKRVKTLVSFAKGEYGEVLYLGARDSATVQIFKDVEGGDRYHPFWANVRFDNGRSQMLSLSHLEMC